MHELASPAPVGEAERNRPLRQRPDQSSLPMPFRILVQELLQEATSELTPSFVAVGDLPEARKVVGLDAQRVLLGLVDGPLRGASAPLAG